MPVIQNTFADDYAVGYPGMVANGETSNRISRSIEDAAGIAFGKPAFRGVGDHGCTGTPGDFLGIVIADKGVPIFHAGQATDLYPQYHNVPIMERGVIWVLAGDDFEPGDQIAFLDGDYVASGTTDADDLPGWVADTSAAAGQMLRITNNRALAAA